mgnify:FL=1
MTFSKVVTTVATAAVALTSLAACSAIDERNEQSTVASTETVMSTETVTREQTSAPAPAAGGANTGGNTKELPRAVTGYTDEARAEMAEDGLAEADVQAVVDAARSGSAEVEWDDDGYWELEWHKIDVDITPDGLVREADR